MMGRVPVSRAQGPDGVAGAASGGGRRLVGTAGDDALVVSGDVTVVRGRGGNDTISGGSAAETLRGGAGDDPIAGGDGADLLRGGGGNDTLHGGFGYDTLRGGRGDDVLDGYRDLCPPTLAVDGGVLRGRGGSDTLMGGYDMTGGKDADHFVFLDEYRERDTLVRDFDVGSDVLVVSARMMDSGPLKRVAGHIAEALPPFGTPEFLLTYHATVVGGSTVFTLNQPWAVATFTVTLDGIADPWSLRDNILIVFPAPGALAPAGGARLVGTAGDDVLVASADTPGVLGRGGAGTTRSPAVPRPRRCAAAATTIPLRASMGTTFCAGVGATTGCRAATGQTRCTAGGGTTGWTETAMRGLRR